MDTIEHNRWILCHEDKPIIESNMDMHGYAVYPHYALGKGLRAVEERCDLAKDYNSTWVLLSDINKKLRSQMFNKSRTYDQVANVGKEEPLRAVCVADDECVGNDTMITHQAPQVKLRYVNESDGKGPRFEIYTIVQGCKDGNFFARQIRHKHCLRKCTQEEMRKLTLTKGTECVMIKTARQAYLSDLIDGMKHSVNSIRQKNKGAFQDDTMASNISGEIAGNNDNMGDLLDSEETDNTDDIARTNIEATGAALLQAAFKKK